MHFGVGSGSNWKHSKLAAQAELRRTTKRKHKCIQGIWLWCLFSDRLTLERCRNANAAANVRKMPKCSSEQFNAEFIGMSWIWKYAVLFVPPPHIVPMIKYRNAVYSKLQWKLSFNLSMVCFESLPNNCIGHVRAPHCSQCFPKHAIQFSIIREYKFNVPIFVFIRSHLNHLSVFWAVVVLLCAKPQNDNWN